MARPYNARWLILPALAALPLATIHAQVLEGVKCPPQPFVPRVAPEDRPVHRCNLDNAPILLSALDSLPTPMYARSVGSDIVVVVDPDGTVNTDMTGTLTRSYDSLFHRQMLEAVRSLRFEAGKLNDNAVRYGFGLSVHTGHRADTIPQRLTWRYVRGELRDSVIGTWEPLPPQPPLTSDQVVMAARSVTRVLREMQVLIPAQFVGYCLLIEDPQGGAIRAAVYDELYGDAGHMSPGWLAPRGCERDVGFRRYRIRTPLRTGGGRTVVRASGDFLRNWPPGFDGRWWMAWRAYCVVPEVPEDWNGTACNIGPVYTGDPMVDGRGADLFETPATEDAPVAFAVEVMTGPFFRTDTIRSSISRVPRLEERALVDPGAGMCPTMFTWAAFADWPGDGELVFWLRFPMDDLSSLDIIVTQVVHADSAFRFHGFDCPDSGRSDQPFALFTLGGVGEPLAGPVRFCVTEPDCTRSYTVRPGRHELAAEPHLTFRLSDIRESTRTDVHARFRLIIDREIEGLVPFVVIRTPRGVEAQLLEKVQDREFDFAVTRTPPFPSETEFRIYLATFGNR